MSPSIHPEAQTAESVEAQAEAVALVGDELTGELAARSWPHPGLEAELTKVEARRVRDRYVAGSPIERRRSVRVTAEAGRG
jgi:hypothetical protein